MLLDMLSEYGYMLANGTTMWEHFELKEDAGMNSHNHPMYGVSSGEYVRSGMESLIFIQTYLIR